VHSVTEAHLAEIFGTYGKVAKVELAKDERVGLSKGFAYIEYPDAAEAQRALEAMDGGQIDGSQLKVSFMLIEPRRRRDPSGSNTHTPLEIKLTSPRVVEERPPPRQGPGRPRSPVRRDRSPLRRAPVPFRRFFCCVYIFKSALL
jgi:RNA recognition motif-containing protein